MKIHVMLGLVLLAGLSIVQLAAAKAPSAGYHTSTLTLTEAEKVERLINFIRGLEGAVFIRNGSEHTCKEAADHLQAKWEKHRNKIRTAGDFIAGLASESGLTGEAYRIRFPDGTVLETREVLLQELKRLEQQ